MKPYDKVRVTAIHPASIFNEPPPIGVKVGGVYTLKEYDPQSINGGPGWPNVSFFETYYSGWCKIEPASRLYNGPINAVTILVTKGMFVCGVTRKNDASAWGLPGGKIDWSDPNPWSAAARELREETGLVATPGNMEEFFVHNCGEYSVATYIPKSYSGVPLSQPNEGYCGWVSWSKLLDGPFGDYNKALKEEYDRRFGK